jgi:endonuclease/exonuclease/phosphatase family metal-dependent hydrolase
MAGMSDVLGQPASRRRAAIVATVAGIALSVIGGSCLRVATPAGPDARPHTGHYAAPRDTEPESLTVVSYNIQYGEDLPLAAADLRRDPRLQNADIYLLQEMDAAGTDTLARRLGCDYVYYRASVSPHHDRDFGNAVLSRWPIASHRVVVLPHAAPLTGQQRVAVVADLELGRRHVRAASVHLSTMIADIFDRVDQAEAAAASLAADSLDVVMGGDLNTVSSFEASRMRRALRRQGLRELNLPAGVTATRKLLGLTLVGLRLDHLYYAGLTPGAAGIASDAQASDHLPIWATFAFDDR